MEGVEAIEESVRRITISLKRLSPSKRIVFFIGMNLINITLTAYAIIALVLFEAMLGYVNIQVKGPVPHSLLILPGTMMLVLILFITSFPRSYLSSIIISCSAVLGSARRGGA